MMTTATRFQERGSKRDLGRAKSLEGSSTGRSQLMLWDTEVSVTGDGRAVVRARRPLCTCDITRVLAILGMDNTQGSRWTVYNLRRKGLLKGWKPGAVGVRSDGRANNAKLVFDMQSVLEYKQKMMDECAFV